MSMSIPVVEQAKIQAQVLIPLSKRCRRSLVRRAPTHSSEKLWGRFIVKEFWRAKREENLGNSLASAFAHFARGDAIDYRVREQSHDAYDIDVTGCRYAQFYKELGEPDLGFILVCSADFWMAEGFGPDIKLTRTQTIMQGGSHCDFRYRRQAERSGG